MATKVYNGWHNIKNYDGIVEALTENGLVKDVRCDWEDFLYFDRKTGKNLFGKLSLNAFRKRLSRKNMIFELRYGLEENEIAMIPDLNAFDNYGGIHEI